MRAATATAAAIFCRVIRAPAAAGVGGARKGKDRRNNSRICSAGLPICTAGRGSECLRNGRGNRTAHNNESEEAKESSQRNWEQMLDSLKKYVEQ